MYFTSRWNSLSRIVAGGSIDGAQSVAIGQRAKVAGLFIFLLPLVIILGTIDFLTDGRSQHWP